MTASTLLKNKKKKKEKEGIYVYLCLIHTDEWQRPTQRCRTIVLPKTTTEKVKKKKKNYIYLPNSLAWHSGVSLILT